MSLSLNCSTAAIIFSNSRHECHFNQRDGHSKLRLLLLYTFSWCSFVSQPATVQLYGYSCKVHHTVFRMSFVLDISCVVQKPKLVFLFLRAVFGQFYELFWYCTTETAFAFIIYQVCIFVLWQIVNPSLLNKNINSQKKRSYQLEVKPQS